MAKSQVIESVYSSNSKPVVVNSLDKRLLSTNAAPDACMTSNFSGADFDKLTVEESKEWFSRGLWAVKPESSIDYKLPK